MNRLLTKITLLPLALLLWSCSSAQSTSKKEVKKTVHVITTSSSDTTLDDVDVQDVEQIVVDGKSKDGINIIKIMMKVKH